MSHRHTDHKLVNKLGFDKIRPYICEHFVQPFGWFQWCVWLNNSTPLPHTDENIMISDYLLWQKYHHTSQKEKMSDTIGDMIIGGMCSCTWLHKIWRLHWLFKISTVCCNRKFSYYKNVFGYTQRIFHQQNLHHKFMSSLMLSAISHISTLNFQLTFHLPIKHHHHHIHSVR